MRHLIYRLCILFFFIATTIRSQNLSDSYITAWKQFYPSKALSEGIRATVFNYEDLSRERIVDWVEFNRHTLQKISRPDGMGQTDPIDARLLRVQVQSEIDKWTKLSLHTSSLSLYSTLIKNSFDPVLEADHLFGEEKSKLICKRLIAVHELCNASKSNLVQITKNDFETGIKDLREVLDFYKTDLPKMFENDRTLQKCDGFDTHLSEVIDSIEELLDFVSSKPQKDAKKVEDIIGRDEYARRLKLYTDSDLSPEELAKMALKEIDLVRELMADVSKAYLISEYPNRAIPENYEALTAAALADMEKDAPLDGADYLEFWNELSKNAMHFIQENKIATLPKNQTLRIMSAPESAGPAARIGWVDSAPPFEPNPLTTLYLPSIPDTLPKQEQVEFWASFNRPFNRMIVIHELFPGHYMQLKISRESPHPIRLLFPYGIYTEGWATFTEKVLLDEGWEAGNHLTLLAHLRKRLENANRAYTSVQVHCNGWNKEQVMQFSTETSLLAPQFAKSLWGRIMKSPMQLTSYFLGGAQFTTLLQVEKDRLGNSFNLQLFMDTIMKAGPIPIDEFYAIFINSVPK